MRDIFLLIPAVFCLSVASVLGENTTLKGTVIFRDTGEPVNRAAVYLDGTSKYALTDSNGHYTLNVPERINTSLIVRHTDYKALVVSNPFEALSDTLFLNLREHVIAAAVVYALPFDREDMMRFFERQFLGITKAGESCVIENKDDIRFRYDPRQKILTAVSDEPLRITNKHLGYNLLFDMHNFIGRLHDGTLDGRSYTVYLGTCAFTDNSEGSSIYTNRRDTVYNASFRALLNEMISGKDLSKSDFYMLNYGELIMDMTRMNWEISDTISMKKIVINRPGEKKKMIGGVEGIVFDEIKIQHKKTMAASIAYFLTDHYLVDPYGNIDNVLGIMFSGAMSAQRVGDMLPLDYVPVPNVKRRKK